MPKKSKFPVPAKGQPCKQVSPRTAVSGLLYSPLLHKGEPRPQPALSRAHPSALFYLRLWLSFLHSAERTVQTLCSGVTLFLCAPH